MLSNLYILSYNNYYNRMVKSESSYTKYFEKGFLVHSLFNTHFNPNDFINTEHTIGDVNNQYDGRGDYLLVVENNSIVSRWFIIEAKRARNGQWILTLRRDVIVDYWNIIKEAPCFIEKGLLSNDDPLIFNSEDMSVNQIKTAEFPLKDGTGCAWIVGYYDSGHSETDPTGYKIYVEEDEALPYDIQVAETFQDWEFYKYTNEDFIGDPTGMQYISNVLFAAGAYRYIITETSDMRESGEKTNAMVSASKLPASSALKEAMANTPPNGFKSFLAYVNSNGLIRYHGSNSSTFKNFQNYNNKVVRFSIGEGQFEYKRISITSQRKTIEKNVEPGSSLWNLFNSAWESTDAVLSIPSKSGVFTVSLTTECYKINTEDILPDTLRGSIDTNAYNLSDAPYSMFAIPYPAVGQEMVIKNTGSSVGDVVINADAGMRVAQAIAKKYSGGSVLYDLQLLPYCPVQKIVKEDGSLDLMNEVNLFSYITSGDNIVSIILNASVSSFTLNIPFEELQITNPKIQAQTDLCRLVSPNFNGQFEFNIIKNGGLQFFNVDCTYLPINPYIHINPNFGGLYGQDFNDARGLICGGDFSLPLINDAWETYKLQNKNYQNIFDRQIQNMEVHNKYQSIQDHLAAVTGSFQTSAAGMLLSGHWAGAIVGGVAGLAAGAGDIAINQALRNEAIDFTKDNFGYQLGNIQAMPNSLARTTAFTFNNKTFPILEYYTCTDREKEALANKIAYNGMTIMAIGTIEPMLQNEWSYGEIKSQKYIKGKLIRLADIGEDFHVAKEISKEIYNGFFFEYVY